MAAGSAAVAASTATGSALPARQSPATALARRTFRDARIRTIGFAYLFAAYAYIQPVGYRHAYPTVAQRLDFAHSLAGNDALRFFYGYPYAPVTVAGYSAWRVGGTLAIVAAAYGLLAAVRALRTEEDAGRTELVLAGILGRRAAFAAAIAATLAGAVILWAAEFAGFVLGGLPLGGSAYLALATATVVPVFIGIGALVSQLAGTRRVALELGGAVIALSLLLRVVADTGGGAGWLRWATPLGWAEELRPFAHPRPLVLALPVGASLIALALAARIAARRDVGTGLIPTRDVADPQLRLLGSPTALALREERASLAIWLVCTGVFAFVLGTVSSSISPAVISETVRRELARLGGGSIATPSGYLSFVFIFFVLAVALFACGQVGAARQEEADERLETLLAMPVERRRWLGGRLLLAVFGAAAISLLAGLLTWAGARSQGVDVSLGRMLEAGANCLPVALLFLGVAALAYALTPRAGAGIAYGLLAAAFLWYLVGSVLGVPQWLVEVTPFAHVGLVPAQPFRATDAVAMLGIGFACCAAALVAFRRRDLAGG
ncbi:MAG: ABC transporter permease [Solirubrobacteraceae bacterium]